MRLLNVDTGELESFLGPDRPRYGSFLHMSNLDVGADMNITAILSHTWGTGEVLFSDIKDISFKTSSAAQAKSAYAKVVNTCRQVATLPLNLHYCWIDTCCIDKDSSAELSEAINSMFAWYSEATVCFAYLEDIETSSVKEDLPNARW
jgi:hypothetical protein